MTPTGAAQQERRERATEKNAIRPFHVNVPEADLADLRRRIAATRWPTRELVEDRSQGVQRSTLRELAACWSTGYDWRTCEAHILDNITLYWLTGTGASAARWYWETGRAVAAARAAGQAPPPVSVPVGFTTFPGELFPAPRSWVETVYPGLAYFNEVDRGGHFAAWEEPQLFASELRAAFRPLR